MGNLNTYFVVFLSLGFLLFIVTTLSYRQQICTGGFRGGSSKVAPHIHPWDYNSIGILAWLLGDRMYACTDWVFPVRGNITIPPDTSETTP